MSINKVLLIGNLGGDPELKRSGSQKPFCNLNIATNHFFTDAQEHRQTRTEWHQIVCFGTTAETCARYLRKGRQVYVEGRIQSERWQDKEGVERLSYRIVANVVQFLGPKPEVSGNVHFEPSVGELTETEAASDEIPW